MQLIVAEKPSVARDLARVLGVRPAGQHGFEGEHHVITWCIGHLVELDEPAAYDPRWKAWRLDTLPMLPGTFRLRAAKHATAQLHAVTQLLRDRRFSSVVNACDAGREGELIFRYVHQFAGGGPPVQRLWISSLTDEAIRRGFAALRPGARFDALGDAARSRSEADWLVGMNATRAITARGRAAGHTALYSIGRVQTPTLAMLVGREREIRAFVPRDYWEIRGELTTADGHTFTAGWRHGTRARLATVALADAIVARDRAQGAAADPGGPRVEKIRARMVREPAPLLFDLTSLQRTANRRFGLSAARTLEIAQALYERHKILTYPRTDSRHLSADMVGELPALFEALRALPDYAPFAAELLATPPRPGKRVIDDAKVHDHHAIIPTGNPVRLAALDRDEQRVFDLVIRRFLGVFYPDAEFAITEAWIRVGDGAGPGPTLDGDPAEVRRDDPAGGSGREANTRLIDALPPSPDRYLARGRVRLVAGWQAVAGSDGGDEARGRGERDGAESTAVLPPLVEGQALDGRFVPVAKQTTPPPRYSEATLLGAMESAGKSIDDEALRAAMKDCGLGTPATRASVIETLLKRDYIVRAKQHLVPTDLGMALIATLPVASLASAELTGAWEARLARIARGEESRAAFMADIARYVAEMIDAVRGSILPGNPGPPSNPVPLRAPEPAPARAASRAPEPAPARAAARPPVRAPAPSARDREPVRDRGAGGALRPPVRAPAPSARDREPVRDRDAGDALRPPVRVPAPSARDRDPVRDRGGGGALRPPVRVPEREVPARARHEGSPREGAARARHEGSPRDGAAPPRRAGSPRTGASGSGGARPARAVASGSRGVSPSRASTGSDLAAELICPRCRRGALIAGARGWGCARWREGCAFVIWFETAGRRLSAAQLRDLVTRGKTRKARFRPDRGDEREGWLVLEAGVDGGSARFEPS